MAIDYYDTTTQGLILGTLSLIFYVVVRLSQGIRPNFIEGIGVVLCGAGTIAGIQLCLISLSKFECAVPAIDDNRVFVFLGGLASIWTSLSTMYTTIKNKTVMP